VDRAQNLLIVLNRAEENILAAMIQVQNPDGSAVDTICEWLEVTLLHPPSPLSNHSCYLS